MRYNFLLNTDSYKTSHYLQYPPHTTYVSSYIESRGGDYANLVFFGLQAFIKEYLQNPITMQNVNEAEEVLRLHGLPFNRLGWQYIVRHHGGCLPVEISAVAEGSVVPNQQVLCQVINTDPACYWLTSYLETALLRAVWYPTTVATRSWHIKKTIKAYMLETAGHTEYLDFKLHDFGARGSSSKETAGLGGMAHLISFQGTDNLSGIMACRQYYSALMPGSSIPAAEHATITCWGKANEARAYENILNQFSGLNKTVAVVSDSYDLWHAIDKIWGGELFDLVVSQGGTVVIRPDSGDPVTIVSRVVQALMEKFGSTTNSLGYRVLPAFIRVIQGDGVSSKVIEEVLAEMKKQKLSAENVTFGMGAELLQKINRDTLEFAMKASAVCVSGRWEPVYKAPTTDMKKQSKPGRLALIQEQGEYQTIPQQDLNGRTNLLQEVYRDGRLLRQDEFGSIRERAESGI